MKTLAAILVEQNAPLVLAEVDVPEPTFGQVRVRIAWSGVCGSQLGEIDGVKGPDRWLPHLLGHEGWGTVEAIGPHVTTVEPGDRVVLHWRPGAGIEAPTPTYGWGDRQVNAGRVTTFQRVAVVSENRMTTVPAELDPKLAVLYGCALTTAFGVLSNDAALSTGESLVVLGAGGVGSSVILAAALAGAYPIVAVDPVEAKLELARGLGATTVVSPPDVLKEVLSAVGSGGADVVIETTGRPEVMAQACALTGAQGRCVLVGVPERSVRIPIDTMPLHFGQVITGSHGGDADPAHDIPRLVRMQLAGRFDPAPLVSHTFPLEKVNEAIEALRSGEPVRCLLEMDG